MQMINLIKAALVVAFVIPIVLLTAFGVVSAIIIQDKEREEAHG